MPRPCCRPKSNDELIERVGLFELEPRVVLDLGAGTGRGRPRWSAPTPARRSWHWISPRACCGGARRYLGTDATCFERVCADALRLPFANASADLVFSNLMLQWCDLLDIAFAEVRRVLKPGGLVRLFNLRAGYLAGAAGRLGGGRRRRAREPLPRPARCRRCRHACRACRAGVGRGASTAEVLRRPRPDARFEGDRRAQRGGGPRAWADVTCTAASHGARLRRPAARRPPARDFRDRVWHGLGFAQSRVAR